MPSDRTSAAISISTPRLQGNSPPAPRTATCSRDREASARAWSRKALVHGLLCERSPGPDFCCTPQQCPVRTQSPPPRRSSEAAALQCDCCAACVQVALRVHPDFTFVGRAANRTDVLIEQVRDLIAKLGSTFARPKELAIIDDAETLNIPAQNALLKTLEEPPGDAIIFLIRGATEHCSTRYNHACARCGLDRFRWPTSRRF